MHCIKYLINGDILKILKNSRLSKGRQQETQDSYLAYYFQNRIHFNFIMLLMCINI